MSNIEEFVGQTISQVTGKPMNCDSWGTYEAPGSNSPTQGLCNGGTVDGTLWKECPSKEECRAERNKRVYSRPSGSLTPAQSLVRVVGGQNAGMPTRFGPPTSYPQAVKPTPAPAQIITPDTTNPYLGTPRVLNSGRAGMHSPTFLPRPGEHWLVRFLKNAVQGMLNSFGHHVSEFTQSVDLFPFDKKDKEKPPE